MYLEYFGFESEPFNITPDSRFLFLSERHQEALGALIYGIEQRKGFIALTGEIGCGKTTICRAMLGRLDRNTNRIALILNPELSDIELLQTINGEFGVADNSESKRELLAALNKFLLAEYQADRNAVLLIDEAQRLSPAALEQVRLLSNLETESAKLLQIALVGQPELGDILDLPELEQLNQRITVRHHITPLSFEEMSDYIAHRIKVAGAKLPVRFQKKALRKVYDYSNGVPRRVNVLCDRALLVGYTREETEVSEAIVAKAIEELGGMPKRHSKKAAPPPGGALSQSEAGHSSGMSRFQTSLLILGGVLSVTVFAGVVFIAALAMTGGLSIVEVRSDGADLSRSSQRTSGAVPAATLIPTATPSPAPTPTPAPTPAPSPTPSPAPTLSPSPTPSPTASPSPSPSPTPSPTASPSPSPTPTQSPSPSPSPSVSRSPSPSPSPSPSQSPSPSPSQAPTLLTQMMQTPEPTPTPEPADPWSYDSAGIMRVSQPAVTFPAAVLTWMEETLGQRLLDSELDFLRQSTQEQIAAMRLTTGAPPLYLRRAPVAANLQRLRTEWLPVLIQTDADSPGFGPWAVLISLADERAVLEDPQAGRITVPLTIVENHLASVMVIFQDRENLTGLQPGASGPRVTALQRRLAAAGFFQGEPTGFFDDFTRGALNSFREERMLTGDGALSPLAALYLLTDTGAMDDLGP